MSDEKVRKRKRGREGRDEDTEVIRGTDMSDKECKKREREEEAGKS